MSGTPLFAQLILDSSGIGVENSDDAFFTRHTFFVFFSGDEVGEALVGVFVVSVFFPPLALLTSFTFLGWWRALNAFTLVLVGATLFPAHSWKFFYRPFVPVSIPPPLV
jgi:hypothetical protein